MATAGEADRPLADRDLRGVGAADATLTHLDVLRAGFAEPALGDRDGLGHHGHRTGRGLLRGGCVGRGGLGGGTCARLRRLVVPGPRAAAAGSSVDHLCLGDGLDDGLGLGGGKVGDRLAGRRPGHDLIGHGDVLVWGA